MNPDDEDIPNDPVSADIESDDEPEFSLRQLSEAYAEVIEQQTGQRPVIEPHTAQASNASEEADDEEGEDDDVACPISPESIVEAILFVGAPRDVKLSSRKIASVLRDVSPREVNNIVKSLNQRYEKENCAYRIKSNKGVFEMVLDPALSDFQNEYYGRNREARLSQAAIDIMAIVAYNQPATREQVEQIRGKPSGSVLAQLVRRELLSVEPGHDEPKQRYYRTTERFLDLFNLDEIADLPQSHDVSDIAELAD